MKSKSDPRDSYSSLNQPPAPVLYSCFPPSVSMWHFTCGIPLFLKIEFSRYFACEIKFAVFKTITFLSFEFQLDVLCVRIVAKAPVIQSQVIAGGALHADEPHRKVNAFTINTTATLIGGMKIRPLWREERCDNHLNAEIVMHIFRRSHPGKRV